MAGVGFKNLRRFLDHFWRELSKNVTVDGYFLAIWEDKKHLKSPENMGVFLDFLLGMLNLAKSWLYFSSSKRIEGKNPPDLRVSSLERFAKALKTTPARLLEP